MLKVKRCNLHQSPGIGLIELVREASLIRNLKTGTCNDTKCTQTKGTLIISNLFIFSDNEIQKDPSRAMYGTCIQCMVHREKLISLFHHHP